MRAERQRSVRPLQQIHTFNSLSEMPPRRIRQVRPSGRAFNSLFEMLSLRQRQARHKVRHLSILYLRCRQPDTGT